MVGAIALKHLIEALAMVLDGALYIYMWLIIARALLSWVNPDPYNPIVRFLVNITEPVLGYLRRRIPLVLGGIDLSPVVVLVVNYILRIFLVQTLMDWARLLQ